MFPFIESLRLSSSDYVNAVLSVLVLVLAAKAAELLVTGVFRRIAKTTKTDVDDRILGFLHKPVFFSIILLGTISAVVSLVPHGKIAFSVEAGMYTLLAVIWAVTSIRISNSFIEHAVRKVSDVTGMSSDIIPLAANLARIVIIVAAAMVILSFWKIDITPVIASAGIAGAAVAFAAKDTIANFFGGISVFVDKPFKIGDYIVLDRGERGEVSEIGLRSTRIRTRDDIEITIPNSIIANTRVTNESAPQKQFRLRVPVPVAYGSDIELVEQTLLSSVKGNRNLLAEPEPRVRLRAFGETALNFELLCWVKEPSLKGLAHHEINCRIYKNFAAKGIRIPQSARQIPAAETGTQQTEGQNPG